jgi:trehalose synthase
VFERVHQYWKTLPEEHRQRVHLANLPTVDLQENAAIVNALQRHAAVVVQKSLREGFGLTVTEAMWKGRPLVASAVGGIQDQIEHGVSGLLLKDPTDLDSFAALLGQVLRDPALAERLGREARARVIRDFLGLRSLLQFAELIGRIDN